MYDCRSMTVVILYWMTKMMKIRFCKTDFMLKEPNHQAGATTKVDINWILSKI